MLADLGIPPTRTIQEIRSIQTKEKHLMRLNKIWGVAFGLLVLSLVSCSKDSPSVTGTCTSNCTPPAPTVSLQANLSTVTAGGSVTLTWNATNALSCSASWTSSSATSGSVSVAPTTTMNYSITCSGLGGTAQGTMTITVIAPPSFAGKVVVQAWGNQPTFTNLRVWISSPSGNLKDSADVQSNGSFAFSSSVFQQIMAGDSLVRRIDVVGSNTRQYLQRISHMSTAEFASRTSVGILSTSPAYNLGPYAGVHINFSLVNGAYVPTVDPNDPEIFYWKKDTVVNGTHFQTYYNPFISTFPLKVAIERNPPWNNTYSMTASDSASMFQGVAQWNQYLGFTAYVVANPSEVTQISGVSEAVDSLVYTLQGAGALTAWSTDVNVEIVSAQTVYAHQYTAVYAPAVMHELIHVDGRGNGCGWHGIESTSCGAGWQVSATPTAEDVVYGMLVHVVCNFQKQTGDRFIFAESDQGERVSLGLPEQSVWRGNKGC